MGGREQGQGQGQQASGECAAETLGEWGMAQALGGPSGAVTLGRQCSTGRALGWAVCAQEPQGGFTYPRAEV